MGYVPLSLPLPHPFLTHILIRRSSDTLTHSDKRQEKLRAEAAANPDGATATTVPGAGTGAGTDSTGPTRQPTEEMDVDPSFSIATPHDKGEGKDKDKDKGGDKDKDEKKDHGQHPPAKKFRMTESMKGIVWQLVLLSNECCRLENEKK